MTPGGVTIHVLGTFSACAGSRAVTPKAAKQRQVLALLALNAGRIVPVTALIEELWGDRPPRSAPATLQTYVSHLRNRLASGIERDQVTSAILRTAQSGYQLTCHTDVEEFYRLARLGRQAAERDDPRAVSELLGQALALWRGAALADVRQGRLLEPEAASLEETRRGLLKRRIQADLRLNRHADVLGELTLLTARHPMDESFCGLLMAALYRAGRVAPALGAFQRLRTILNDELAVEPGPRLQRVHQAILSGAPAVEVDALLAPDGGQPDMR